VGYKAGLSLALSMTFSYLAIRHMIEGGRIAGQVPARNR
jgi:hypothetical protein